jgi:hypothetical protein
MNSILRFKSLMLMTCLGLGTSAAAMTPHKVHVIQNLDSSEARLAVKLIERNGYQVSKSAPFTEGTRTFVITKAMGDELDPASVQLEVMEKEKSDLIPKTVFNMKLETKDIREVLSRVPSPDQLSVMPVAYQR